MKRIGEKGSGKFERISWDEAYDLMAENLNRVKEVYGAKSVVFYAGYPKWYRPALLRLANAFGSPNFCTESSTCFQASALAWRSLYGNRICFPDLAHTKTLLIWTSNLFHSNTPMGKMFRSLKERGVRIIVVDPRSTVTVKEADLHLQLTPGTDGALALAMAHVIIEEDLYDKEFVEKYVSGFEEYKNYVRTFTPEKAQEITGVVCGSDPAGGKDVRGQQAVQHPVFGVHDCPPCQWISELPGSIFSDCADRQLRYRRGKPFHSRTGFALQ